MYSITKRIEIAGAHKLNLPYDSPCKRLHGHNWIIEVEVKGRILNQEGMLVDFSVIKKVVNELDHKNLSELIEQNPTAEKIAEWICNKIQSLINIDEMSWRELATMKDPDDVIPIVSKVTVQESEGNKACYTP